MANPNQSSRSAETAGTLASCYQEVLTTIVRMKSSVEQSEQVRDRERFRAEVKELLRAAETQAAGLGVARGDIGRATYAVVAFIDTSIMTPPRLPIFADWENQTLQAELYQGRSIGGEAFFDSLEEIKTRGENAATGELLELYLTCGVLGFQGRYRTEQFNQSRPQIVDKLTRIRPPSSEMSPQWHPSKRRIFTADGGQRTRIAINVLAATVACAAVLFIVFRLMLDRGTSHFAGSIGTLLARLGW